ncbi:polysaccharide biosynthesis tyrosine autokinase [Acidaminobacter sp. JC074]|uniref:polysaccharide biosynthesis tyrosine autokinase n=1 Tax=Acidaminobacter sp. JC074 TaxID=2530199 RepID=UPI001F0FC64B|nr:polysaccharide biosynthesis tyrosine autokinase [Acidaminobacter sp. JC074]MCH4889720.1 polysaccharide biosynthesis tyrosine autokinase [Acidaminobacter sp. JC074]
MENYQREIEIFDLFQKVFKRFWIIALTSIAVGASFFVVNNFYIPDTYSAETTIFIGKESGALAEFNFLDLEIGAQLIDDYKELIKTKAVRNEVISRLNLNIHPDSLLGRVNVHTVDDSRFMKIVVLDASPHAATRIANAISDVLIDKAEVVIGAKNIQVVDAAEVNERPISPNVLNATIIGVILGFLVGLIISIILVLMDNKVNIDTNLEDLLGVPFLGSLLPVKSSDHLDALVMHHNNNTYDAELYKLIRTNLDFMSVDNKCKVMMFTSAQMSEGKSTTVSNIALAFSQVGKKVLLIDADLRKPNLHNLFSIRNYSGLSNLIVNNVAYKKIINQKYHTSIITSGPKPPNPNELLMSKKVDDIVMELRNMYDIILIDSPPILSVADSLSLARCVDGIVMIAACKQTKKENVVASIKKIRQINGKILGVVMTKAKVKKKEYYSYK